MKKKMIALMLSLVMLLPLFVSCETAGDTEQTPDTPDISDTAAEFVPLENVYGEAALATSAASLSGSVSNLAFSGGRVYYDMSGSERANDGEVMSYTRIYSALPDGSDEKIAMQIGGGDILNAFSVDPDGSIWTIITRSSNDLTDPAAPVYQSEFILNKYATDGEELLSRVLTDIALMYPRGIITDADGNIYVMDMMALYVFTGDTAELLFSLNENGYITSMLETTDGKIAYFLQMEGIIKVINFALQSADSIAPENGRYITGAYSGYGDYDFFYIFMHSLYGYNIGTGQVTEVISFLNSDLTQAEYSHFLPISDSEFIAAKPMQMLTAKPGGIVRLTANPEASTNGKVVLTLGVVTVLDDVTREMVQRFNKSNDAARIVIKDYSEYNISGDIMGGARQLDLDLIAGKAPDILGLALGFPAEKYISTGALENLLPYFEADDNVSRDDLFENILDFGMSDGGLYSIVTAYSVMSYVGKTSVFGEGYITLEELGEIADNYPTSSILAHTARINWITANINARTDSYIDWETGTANYSNDDFYTLLELGWRFPDEIDFANFTPTDYTQNDALITSAYLMDPRYTRNINAQFGEQVTDIGFPASNGNYGGMVFPVAEFAVSSSSEHKDIAWEFISGIISDDDYMPTASISINKNAFENKMRVEMTPVTQRDLSKGAFLMTTASVPILATSQEDIDPALFTGYELTEEEVAHARKTIENASIILYRDSTIVGIVQEEAAAYYGGLRTVEETAQMIESRVNLYIGENK